jgi:RimJ/RimL family protein N-acetyltransferase
LYSDAVLLCLRRDLLVPPKVPAATVSLVVRPVEGSEELSLFNPQATGITGEGLSARLSRLDFLRSGIGTCYVALTPDEKPCYVQWLIGPQDNDSIQQRYHRIYPRLGPNEAMLEAAFTFESFRGRGIMPCAMSQITEKARDLGARYVNTFVGDDNIASLKGCKHAGFVPYSKLTVRCRFFRRKAVLERLPAGAPYSFDVVEPHTPH